MFAELDGYAVYERTIEIVGHFVRARAVEAAVDWGRANRPRKRLNNRTHKARLRLRAKSDPQLAEKLRLQKREQARRYRARHLERVRRWDREYRKARRRSLRAQEAS